MGRDVCIKLLKLIKHLFQTLFTQNPEQIFYLSLLIEYLCLQKYVYKASLTNMHVANNT